MNISKALLDGLSGVELALFWAGNGMRVLPVSQPPAKRPLIKAWQDHCTDNQTEIHAWWFHHPNARVGLATGDPGFDVLDFDVAEGKPGLAQLEKLLDLGIIEPGTFYLVGTPSGGRHLLFKGSDQRNKQNEKAVPGVDFRGVGGQVLAAGNDGYTLLATPHAGLGPISWDEVRLALEAPKTNQETLPGTRIPPIPPRPSERLPVRKTRLVAPARGYDDPIGEESPLDWYTRNHDMEALLAEAGWRFAYDHGEKRHYTRPGKNKTDGVSGNIATMNDGRRVFYSFSSSVDLPTDTALSTAQLYAWMHHGGDMRAAASQIRRTMMPVRERPSSGYPAAPPVASVVLGGTGIPPAAPVAPEGSTSTDLVPIVVAGEPQMVTDFWSQRPGLRNIRWFARERRVSPWATLGAVLAQTSCRIGPHVVLPPIVGGVASLNLLVGLVGPSGKGKGAAIATAADLLRVEGKFMMEEVGTAQGIDASFTETPAKGGPVQFNDVAFFYVPEIDTIKAHAEMSGSALLPTLRKVWSGEPLGAKYAGKERRRPVRGHAYRASVVAGIQPKRSGVLLADADGGTPQRWLWLPVSDPGARRRTDKLVPPIYNQPPPHLDYDVWIPQGEQRGEKDEPLPVEAQSRYEIPVCRRAQNEIIDARELNLLSDEASMDSHSLLTRLKVAALLAFLLEAKMEVDDFYWDLALPVMWMSNATRQICVKAMEESEEDDNHRRGRNRAAQSMAEQIAVPVLRDRRADRIHELGLKALGILQATPGQEYSPKQLREATMDAKSQREFGADVLAAVIAVPGVVQGPEVSSGGRKIRKLSWTPSNSLAMSAPNPAMSGE